MASDTDHLSFAELCRLADLPGRTVRFYIGEGLADRPLGAKRGAYYTPEHLNRLLAIRKWQKAGLSLGRIRELVAGPEGDVNLPPERPRQAGDVTVLSHIHLGPGVELVIDPREAGLSSEEVRAISRGAAAILDNLKKETPR